jgi:hypothetical protein
MVESEKRHIQMLQTEEGLAVKHEDKSKEIERYFREVLGTKQPRSVSINWDELNYPVFNLAKLDEEITGEEVNKVIASIPKESSPDVLVPSLGGARCWQCLRG